MEEADQTTDVSHRAERTGGESWTRVGQSLSFPTVLSGWCKHKSSTHTCLSVLVTTDTAHVPFTGQAVSPSQVRSPYRGQWQFLITLGSATPLQARVYPIPCLLPWTRKKILWS